MFENVVATTGKALAERLANTSKGCEKFSAVFEDTGAGWRFRTPACNPWAPEGQCDAWSPCSRRVVLVPRVIGQADGRAAVDVDGLALAFIESVTCTKEKRCDVAVRFVTGRSSIAVGASLGTYNAATGIRVSHLTQ